MWKRNLRNSGKSYDGRLGKQMRSRNMKKGCGDVTRWTKQAFPCSKFLSPGGQLWANTAFEGSKFYSIGVP